VIICIVINTASVIIGMEDQVYNNNASCLLNSPYNARYSMGQTEKAHFYLSPSHIDIIGHANWTCQADNLWFKKIQKYSKLNPPKWTSIFCQQGLSMTQKLKLHNLLINPNWGI